MSATQKPPREKKGISTSFIVAGIACLIYVRLFPLYRLSDYLLLGAIVVLINRIIRSLLSRRNKQPEAEQPRKEPMPETGNVTVDDIIHRGQETIMSIRAENNRIPDPEVSERIDKLEYTANRIFRTVIEQPGKAPQIRKFMDYYLPTTLKMLVSYRRLDERHVTGQSADAARKRISDALDIVQSAFDKQLETLFQDDMLDISTDIDVLEQMLKQDGLIDNGFKRKQSGEA